MSLKPRTLGLLALGAAMMLGLGYVAFQEDPVPVDLHTLTRGPLEITVNADGVTRIKEIYDVSSPITGTALRSPVAVGDPVIAGETVIAIVRPAAPALLDSRTRLQAQASVQEAEAAVHVAETDLAKALDDQTLAQSQYDRAQTLVERGVASLTRLEDAAQRLAVATGDVRALLAPLAGRREQKSRHLDRVAHHVVQNTAALELAFPEPGHVRPAVLLGGAGDQLGVAGLEGADGDAHQRLGAPRSQLAGDRKSVV